MIKKFYSEIDAVLDATFDNGLEYDAYFDEGIDDYKEGDSYGFLDTKELAYYEEPINDAIKKSFYDEDELTYGLMKYFDIPDDDMKKRIKGKVKSAFPKVEVVNEKLYAVMECETNTELNEAEANALKNYFRGQYSDGWGEGFAQRGIETSNGVLYASFSPNGFQIKTEEEFSDQMEAEIKEDDLHFDL